MSIFHIRVENKHVDKFWNVAKSHNQCRHIGSFQIIVAVSQLANWALPKPGENKHLFQQTELLLLFFAHLLKRKCCPVLIQLSQLSWSLKQILTVSRLRETIWRWYSRVFKIHHHVMLGTCGAGSMCCVRTPESAVAAVEINFQLDVMVKITV